MKVKLPDAGREDLDEWNWLLDGIVDRIHWDCNYQSSNDLMNLPSDAIRQVRQIVGINEEYDLTIPPDPDDDSPAAARQKLAMLVRSAT